MTITTKIPTLAAKLKPGTYTPAKIRKMLDDIILTGRDVTNEDLAKLYARYLPKPPKAAKSSFEWVFTANRERKDIRDFLNYAYCTDGRLWCSNGHVIHSTPCDLETGYYDVSMNRVELDYRYPDMVRALHGNGVRGAGEQIDLSAEFGIEMKDGSKRAYVALLGHDNCHHFDLQYVNDVKSHPSPISLARIVNGGRGLSVEYEDDSLAFVCAARK